MEDKINNKINFEVIQKEPHKSKTSKSSQMLPSTCIEPIKLKTLISADTDVHPEKKSYLTNNISKQENQEKESPTSDSTHVESLENTRRLSENETPNVIREAKANKISLQVEKASSLKEGCFHHKINFLNSFEGSNYDHFKNNNYFNFSNKASLESKGNNELYIVDNLLEIKDKISLLDENKIIGEIKLLLSFEKDMDKNYFDLINEIYSLQIKYQKRFKN